MERHTNASSPGESGRAELGKERKSSRFYKSLTTVMAMGYILGAALVVWLGTFIYMVVLVGRERKLRKEIEELRRMIDRFSAKE
nr:CcmD family protein [Bacilli bacterium]